MEFWACCRPQVGQEDEVVAVSSFWAKESPEDQTCPSTDVSDEASCSDRSLSSGDSHYQQDGPSEDDEFDSEEEIDVDAFLHKVFADELAGPGQHLQGQPIRDDSGRFVAPLPSRTRRPPASAGQPRSRVRDQLRRRMSQALVRVHSTDSDSVGTSLTRSKSIEGLMQEPPSLQVPSRKEDLKHTFHKLSLDAIVDSIETKDGLLSQIVQATILGDNFRSTPWSSSVQNGVEVRQSVSRFSFPPPDTIPEVAKRLLSIPSVLQGTSVCCYEATYQELPEGALEEDSENDDCSELGEHCSDSREHASCCGGCFGRMHKQAKKKNVPETGHNEEVTKLVFVERSSMSGLMYSDLVDLCFVMEFTKDTQNDAVELRHWANLVWKKELPWSHRFLKRIGDAQVRCDAEQHFPDIVRILERLGNTEVVSPLDDDA